METLWFPHENYIIFTCENSMELMLFLILWCLAMERMLLPPVANLSYFPSKQRKACGFQVDTTLFPCENPMVSMWTPHVLQNLWVGMWH